MISKFIHRLCFVVCYLVLIGLCLWTLHYNGSKSRSAQGNKFQGLFTPCFTRHFNVLSFFLVHGIETESKNKDKPSRQLFHNKNSMSAMFGCARLNIGGENVVSDTLTNKRPCHLCQIKLFQGKSSASITYNMQP